MSPMVDVDVAGETLRLLPQLAAFWIRTSTLLLADPHFGKAATFRAAGVFVPESTTDAILARLDRLLAETRASRIVFLGDFLHAREGRHPRTLDVMNGWRRRHASVDMLLVRGNHDRRAGDPPRELEIRCENSPVLEPPFAFLHYPGLVPGHYALAGHLHPGATLTGAGRQRAYLPCFWLQPRTGVLPAFGEFTGLAPIDATDGDQVYVVADDSVIHVAANGRSSSTDE